MVECVSQKERKKGRKERKKEKFSSTSGIRTHTSCFLGKDVGMGADGGWAPDRGGPPKGGVASLPTTSAGGDFGDSGS